MLRWTWLAVFGIALSAGIGLYATSESVAQEKGKGKAGKEKRAMTFEVYKDKSEEFRWRLKAANGNIMATCGQGYKDKADCMSAIKSIQAGAANAKVDESSLATN